MSNITTTTLNLSTAQIVPLAIFTFLMTLFGIVGNTTVLYSSIRYNAIKVDKVSLVFIQQLAAADILYTIIAIFPCLVTYSAGKWILGRIWCFITAQISFIPGLANIMLVLAITLHRLMLVTSPFRNTSITTARASAGCIWGIATLATVIIQSYYRTKGVFNPDIGICTSTLYDMEDTQILTVIFTPLFVLIPLFLITISNVILSVIAVKQATYLRNLYAGLSDSVRALDSMVNVKDIALQAREPNLGREHVHKQSSSGDEIMGNRSPRRKFFMSSSSSNTSHSTLRKDKSSHSLRMRNHRGLIMICSISGTFVLSWLPYIIFNLLKLAIPKVPAQVEILAFTCIYINSFANPILYSLTNRRFGRYVKQVIRKMFCCKAVRDLIGSDNSDGTFNFRVRQRNRYRTAKVNFQCRRH